MDAAISQDTSPSALSGAAVNENITSLQLCSGASDANTTSFRAEIIRLTNAARDSRSVARLTEQDKLNKAAQAHAIDMACNATPYNGITSPSGVTPFARMIAFGYVSALAPAANVAYGYDAPGDVVPLWLSINSSSTNMLNSNYTEVGVGYISTASRYLWVMTLSKPKS
jgi:uncharacterized protein YkwD